MRSACLFLLLSCCPSLTGQIWRQVDFRSREVIPGTEDIKLQPGVSLDGLDLSNALLNVQLDSSSFMESNLSGAQLSGSFTLANFHKADLTGALVSGHFLGATLSEANLTGLDIAGRATYFRRPGPFLFADLSDSILRDLDVESIFFTGADLQRADLSNSTLEYVDFRSADLRQANFSNVYFRKGNYLELADIRQVDFSSVRGQPNLTGAIYDQLTLFPWEDFSPAEEGMRYVPAINGDTDLNGEVEFSDFLTLTGHFGSDCTASRLVCWQRGDSDGDGRIAFSDFLDLSAEFAMPRVSAVPECTSNYSLAFVLFILVGGRSGLMHVRCDLLQFVN